jgi:hypothetical protein
LAPDGAFNELIEKLLILAMPAPMIKAP